MNSLPLDTQPSTLKQPFGKDTTSQGDSATKLKAANSPKLYSGKKSPAEKCDTVNSCLPSYSRNSKRFDTDPFSKKNNPFGISPYFIK
jgi:hypothetical protein